MRRHHRCARWAVLAIALSCTVTPSATSSPQQLAPQVLDLMSAAVVSTGVGMRMTDPRIEELWVAPHDLATRDLYNGQWGIASAPDPNAVHRLVAPTKGGINNGMTVRDPGGREWRVKQPPDTGRNAEGPIEVVLSRVLSAVGYHQPPVYFVRAFQLDDGKLMFRAAGGRFRLSLPELKDVGEWKWMNNPVRRLNALLRVARHSLDVQQLRSEGLQQHALRISTT